jgi:hypothetical protein
VNSVGKLSESFMEELRNLLKEIKTYHTNKNPEFNEDMIRHITNVSIFTKDDIESRVPIQSENGIIYIQGLPVTVYKNSEIRTLLSANSYICNNMAFFDFWEKNIWTQEEIDNNKKEFNHFSDKLNSVTTEEERKELRKMYLYKEDKQREGWKIHISLDSFAEYLFSIQYLLPELRSLGITHKIVASNMLEELNDREKQPLQAGKNIVIYAKSIYMLAEFSDRVKNFISTPSNIQVVTDKHLGGRIFGRYSGFYNDYVINPETGLKVILERQEGVYKPYWIEEPPSLKEIFKYKK